MMQNVRFGSLAEGHFPFLKSGTSLKADIRDAPQLQSHAMQGTPFLARRANLQPKRTRSGAGQEPGRMS
jgi:hypothetical protein